MSATADPGQHEWHRLAVGWHIAFAVLAVTTAVLIVLDPPLSGGERVLGVALVGVFAGWYPLAGARLLRAPRSRSGWWYVGVAVALTIAVAAVSPAGTVLLFVLFPQVWAMLPVRQAVLGTTVAVAGIGTVFALRYQDPASVLVSAGLALVCAVGVGLWISRIIDQSAQRARLVAELDATRAELAAVSREAGALAERERIARDIHDTVAQGFTSVLLLLDALEADFTNEELARGYLQRARDTARDNLAEARSLIAAATPPALRSASLPAALQLVVDRIGPDLPGGATLTVEGEPRPLPAELEIVALRAGQEALANVRRHARASRVEVLLQYRSGILALRIGDDGQGFDAEQRPAGFGLAGLRERVTTAGGSVMVRTAPGAGVTVDVELPT
ncbi:sensor histidine kinase [Dactylosporangium vinaceum]|uniref:Oxygen sensor histidine kinase NreB n=1 Tax=Dactylosporangium vinaceum TaxID=53362 RepID=A0ABV5LY03_9ACTN|nr:sensor histidine kinase [Dactylosporangium vinaceum]UAC00985.1 sensor histidine kinase [Dactylosporangium vinaceum]